MFPIQPVETGEEEKIGSGSRANKITPVSKNLPRPFHFSGTLAIRLMVGWPESRSTNQSQI